MGAYFSIFFTRLCAGLKIIFLTPFDSETVYTKLSLSLVILIVPPLLKFSVLFLIHRDSGNMFNAFEYII